MASRRAAAAPSNGAPITIKSIHVENYLGIQLFEAALPPAGAVISGRNGSGKSSVLKAVQAALAAQGVAPEAIHVGAQKGEIRIDLGAVSVRRVITSSGSSVKVVRTDDGAVLPAPQTYLRDLLGVSALDPLAFWREKDAKKRRAMLLDALPVTVTPAMLRSWVGGAAPDSVIAQALTVSPSRFTPAEEDVQLPGHGLDLVARVRASLYERRAEQNRATKTAAEMAARARSAHDAIEGQLGDAPVLSIEEAEKGVADARAEEASLDARRRAAIEAATRRQNIAEKAKAWREDAARRRAAVSWPTEEEIEAADVAVANATDMEEIAARRVKDLEAALVAARAELESCRTVTAEKVAAREALDDRERMAEKAQEEAERDEAAAAELEAVAGDIPAEPTQDEAAAVAQRRVEAEARLSRARLGAELAQRARDLAMAEQAHETQKKLAADLDRAVVALTTDAPRELLANTPGLDDLSIEGDVIRYGGVALDDLSGAEQMTFAVRLARALNARCKILIVDGLEAVDPDRLPSFIEEATRDGYQLLAARVAPGERKVEPIAGGEEAIGS